MSVKLLRSQIDPHIVKMISTKQLLDLWGEGKNSFKADPPNAVLSANGFDARIVILESMIINNEQLTYTLVLTDPSTPSLKGINMTHVILTIDIYKGAKQTIEWM